MVPDLSCYRSHQDKALLEHISGVLDNAQERCNVATSPERLQNIVKAACVFHDIGKTNPLFQAKLPTSTKDQWKHFVTPYWRSILAHDSQYSNHAYLSAYLFLAVDETTEMSWWDWKPSPVERTAIAAIIAHHHGNLPDFRNIFHKDEIGRLISFLSLQPSLPIENFLRAWELKVNDEQLGDAADLLERKGGLPLKKLPESNERLDYFLETQFAFAALIESDKRDAGDNEYLRRAEQLEWAKEHFAPLLQERFEKLKSDEKPLPLNALRTQMRDEAVQKLRAELQKGTRTFSLTAPTGAGKTFALLALAEVLREYSKSHAIVYGLPFLTITEQVEGVCREVFGDEFVSRFDSRTQNKKLDELRAKLDDTPQEARNDASRALLQEAFSSETFDAAFTVTTFVQIFETLLSNRNAILLKLPNFAKTIFLLDEIQALPPRLYVFFAAYLQAFCEKFDCYAIFSTATMPAFDIVKEAEQAHKLFHEYSKPVELLSPSHFENPIFDRYEVRPLQPTSVDCAELAQKIVEENTSCLVVLNTIADSKNLFKLLSEQTDAEVILLNTHFTLRDRQNKFARCKEFLKEKKSVILVSTQLIEAGVDIDFPVVFRDLCPLPSLIQTAGRCNRNGEPKRGLVRFFELLEEGKSRAELIYKGEPKWFLQFSRDKVLSTEGFREDELLSIQIEYFMKANSDLMLGQHRLRVDDDWDEHANLVEQIDNLAFASVGSFQLINDGEYGESLRYFVPQDEDDIEDRFECLQELVREVVEAKRKAKGRLDYKESKNYDIKIQAQLRKMAPDIVQFRVPRNSKAPDSDAECCGVHRLSLRGDYSSKTGVSFNGDAMAML